MTPTLRTALDALHKRLETLRRHARADQLADVVGLFDAVSVVEMECARLCLITTETKETQE